MAVDRHLTPVRFGIWSIRVDHESTEQAYAHCTDVAAACACAPCRNFVAARQHAFPEPALALLAELGIDPCCEAEVYWQGREESGLHQYGGWFHFVGELEAEIDNIETVGQHAVLWFTRHVALVPAAFGDNPVIQLEFVTAIPWVLDEPEPE